MARLTVGAGALLACVFTLASQTGADWQSTFPVDKKNLGLKGSNPYFILRPGYQLAYRHGRDTVTATVLDETKMVDGVECRVVQDIETKNNAMI